MSIETDVVEVVDGKVARVWRNATKNTIGLADPANAGTLHEVEHDTVHPAYIFNGEAFVPPPRVVQPARISAACERRILAVLSRNTQSNIQAYAADLALKAATGAPLSSQEIADVAAARAAREWTIAMVAACRRMIEVLDGAYVEDASWPEVPAAVSALAARF